MLNYYYSNVGQISRLEPGAILMAQTQKRLRAIDKIDAYKRQFYPAYDIARSYRTHAQDKSQRAIGRIRAALIRALSRNSEVLNHATVGSIARQVMKCARYVRLDVDNPDTHLAFSPSGVKAHDLKRRRSLTFAKFLRRKCGDLLKNRLIVTDAHMDLASAAFMPVASLEKHLQIVAGEAAFDVYDDAKNGISSCMSGAESKADIVSHHFCANSGKLFLVVAYDPLSKKLAMRAKLWRNDDGAFWLDRIYFEESELFPVQSETAIRENVVNWLSKQVDYSNLVDYCNSTLRHNLGENMPYCDRCQQFDRIDDRYVKFHDSGEFCADNTNGYDNSAGSRYTCCSCNCRVDEDDMRTHENGNNTYCEYCYNEAYTYDERNECDIDSDCAVDANWTDSRGRSRSGYTNRDDCVELSNGDYWVSDDDAICEIGDSGDYALRDDCTELYDDTFALSEDCVELASGGYALADECVEIDDEWYLENEETSAIVDDYGFIQTIVDTEAHLWMPSPAELILRR